MTTEPTTRPPSTPPQVHTRPVRVLAGFITVAVLGMAAFATYQLMSASHADPTLVTLVLVNIAVLGAVIMATALRGRSS